MMVMTAKVDFKKIAIVIAGILVLIVGLVMLLGNKGSEPTASTAVSVAGNDDRVRFLNGFGWEVTTSPTQSSQVRIPDKTSEVFERYNTLQKSQGYDLSRYAGQTVMRYVYEIKNYPGATEPVYATVLISKNQVIGGDVTDTAPKGVIQSFKMPTGTKTQPEATEPDVTEDVTSETAPAETTAPTKATVPTKASGQ